MAPQFYTIFQEPWWLDAAAPGAWDAVEVERGGQSQAYFPYVVTEKNGIRTLGQPALTQTLGPWVKDTGAGYTRALSREMSLYRELIEGLPDHDVFHQNFAPQVTNWLPFYWEGFTQTTRYTYTFDLTQSLDQLRANMDKRYRRQLSAAQKELVGEVSEDLETLLRLNDMTFARQGLDTPYSHDFVYRLDQAVQKHAKRWIVLARGRDDGVPHAGIYMVSDGNQVYSLFSGVDPQLREHNGGIVARWKAFEAARGNGMTLDLQGSMIESIERRNRNLGAYQIPMMSLYRSNGRQEKTQRKQELKRAPLVALARIKNQVLQLQKGH